MAILATLAVVIQVLSAIGVIVLVLLQHGKGADMGAAFGSGSSGSLFGATGSANFMSRLTAALATVFFVCTLALAFFGTSRGVGRAPASVMDSVPAAAPAAPAASDTVPASPAPAAPSAPSGGDAVQKSAPGSDIPK
jgi:preprotein translocase subunit SecG